MSRERVDARYSSFAWGRLLYSVLFVGVIVAGLYCGYLSYTTIRALAAHTSFKTIPVILRPARQPPKESLGPEPQPEQEPVAQTAGPLPKTEIYPDIENKERINILFLGIDQRPGESTACRTDTMILASINPQDMSVSLLSIPRDLWVFIPHPKHPENKINTAHYWGEIEGYPGGGPALAMRTVYNNLGVRVHYYVRLNFTGFERIIDRIGGIDIDVPATIDDEQYPNGAYGFEHLYIQAGRHHFDGQMALKYARTRYGSDDFTRMHRQQQIILAVRDRVLSLQNLPQLVRQLPQLYRDMGDSVETNIPLDLMFTLAEWAQQIERENIRMESIDRRMTRDWTTADGVQVLILERTKARSVIDDLFRSPTPEVEKAGASQVERLEAEGARVVVYNGTSIYGLAGQVSSFLEIQKISVGEPQNADSFDYEHTILRVYVDKPFTVNWLTSMFGISEENIFYRQPGERDIDVGDVDIAIIIGQDFPVDKFE
jgi:LCP family protein required for cell wall assembly